ncbi:hypothetical protein C2869_10765 [Saccharobesus litoralis]|uniref:Nucleotidyl transferase domain-containing protein n=1 Tax=Saccharobesus litoralis TaxID=2172099 RepID=A0A2S0VRP0_9ALTE|nr:nucleotidyltransferase family protein [Saccharobesus litoralis]AWB66886.1 hypothetical protein C2869_10765 [Saccharobesus litoralis]
MKAMILAAGQGKRMRPLTLHTPKPLLTVNNKPLMQYHIEALRQLGIKEFVVNLAYLGSKIEDYFADGTKFGVHIQYSYEEVDALETAGGIKQALSLLGNEEFILVNGDVWTDYDFSRLQQPLNEFEAKLVLVNNPEHHKAGDFAIDNGLASLNTLPKYTYAGIGRFSTRFFQAVKQVPAPLGPLLKASIQQQKVCAELHEGDWCDVGTPARLASLKQQVE